MRLVYAANMLVAGAAGCFSLFAPQVAFRSAFEGTNEPSLDTRILGALWLTIAIVSAIGLLRPLPFSPKLLMQLLYTGGWLLVVALPFLFAGRADALPMSMSIFFTV